jgi:ribonuclease D
VNGPGGQSVERDAAEQALEEWRAAVAREMGVPTYFVLGDRALAQLATGDPEGHGVPGSTPGPRFRAKFDAELRRLLARLGRPPGTQGPSIGR